MTVEQQLLLGELERVCDEPGIGVPCFGCGQSSIMHTFKRLRAEQQETLDTLKNELAAEMTARDAAEQQIDLRVQAQLAWEKRAEQAEQQLAASKVNEDCAFKELSNLLTNGNAGTWEELTHAAEQIETREAQLEQQLATATLDWPRSRTEYVRAQVLAEVKALAADIAYITDSGTVLKLAAFCVKLDALQPSPDLAVLSTAEREQALEKARRIGIAVAWQAVQEMFAKGEDVAGNARRLPARDIGAEWAEARRLLQLPAQPTTEGT